MADDQTKEKDNVQAAGDAQAAVAKKDDGNGGKKKFKMPSAYVIVFIVLVLVAILTFFIPVSVHDHDSGTVTFNAMLDEHGNLVENAGPQPYGIWDILMAPVKGFMSAADVAIALLMAGGFLAVMDLTGGLEAAIGGMLKKLKGSVLIFIMTLMCAMMGTVFGFWEEILAFSLVIIPMFVLAGYDVMLGMGIMFLGATVGNMSAVVNPFATGAAVAALNSPDLTMGSGIILRMVIFAILFVICVIPLMRYGAVVKANPKKGALYGVPGVRTTANTDKTHEFPEMTPRRMVSAILFVVMIVVLIIGYIPWEDLGGKALSDAVNSPWLLLEKIPVVGDIFGAGNVTPFGGWGFDEFSVLFFFGAILLLIINKMPIDDWISSFISGAKDLLGVVFVLAIARGIAILMGSSTSGMSVTLVYWISGALESIPQWTFAIFGVAAYLLIGLALQSTSGVAGISMPILGAVAAALFATSAVGGAGGQIILISAFTIGLNFMCLLFPGAVNLGVSEMYGIPYSNFLKFMLKYSILFLIVGTILLSIAPYIGLVH